MPKKVRSAKGQVLDFDLLRIKEQLGDAAAPANVQARQDFIDQKMRRRVKRVKDKIAEAKRNPKPVDVNKTLNVESAQEGKKIDEAKPQKRKIRRKK